MRKIAWLAAALAIAAPSCADEFGGFRAYADSGALKPFARDLGGILGAATFHGGRNLGVTGWDVGGRGGMQFVPEENDRILRSYGIKLFGLPWVQAEVGMPFRFDGFIRGISYHGVTVAGGGLRYGLLRSNDKPWALQLLLSANGHMAAHDDFSAQHFGMSVVGSMGIPVFTPYLGAGFDRTKLTAHRSIPDPTIEGMSVTTVESRFTAGVRLRPWQFFYISTAYFLAHGRSGAEAAMGLRF